MDLRLLRAPILYFLFLAFIRMRMDLLQVHNMTRIIFVIFFCIVAKIIFSLNCNGTCDVIGMRSSDDRGSTVTKMTIAMIPINMYLLNTAFVFGPVITGLLGLFMVICYLGLSKYTVNS